MNKIKYLLFLTIFMIILTGCGKTDNELDTYKAEMTDFSNKVSDIVDSINAIDVDSDSRTEELLSFLDELDSEFAKMGNLSVPKQFSNIEDLADDASANLSKSVQLYHQAFDQPENYDPQLVDAALEYYNRAFKRIDYIGTILQGKLPEDDSVTIIHESGDEDSENSDSNENSEESNVDSNNEDGASSAAEE